MDSLEGAPRNPWKEFFSKRRDKWWVLVLSLLALASFFFFSRDPYREIRLKTPLPTPLLSLGEGDFRWGMVIWWRCGGCKRLLETLEPHMERGELRGQIDLYLYDQDPVADGRLTASFFCYREERGDLLASEAFRLFYLEGERPQRAKEDLPCWQKGLALSQEHRQYFKGVGLLWTPALIKDGVILYPSEENYRAFLREIAPESPKP